MVPEVKGIRLLYSFEFEKYKDIIPHAEEDWWVLDHPDSEYDIVNNAIHSDRVQSFTIRSILGIRPVLEISSVNLLYEIDEIGSEFYLYNQIWTVLDKNIAICNRCIADSRYGTTNIWSSSDVKKYLDNFLYRNKFLSYDNKNNTDYIRRSDAILAIQRHGIGYDDPEDFSPEQAERYIISNLKKIPSINIEEKTHITESLINIPDYVYGSDVSENDYIKRKDVLDIIRQRGYHWEISRIEQLPGINISITGYAYKCSCCGHTLLSLPTQGEPCPNCGASLIAPR